MNTKADQRMPERAANDSTGAGGLKLVHAQEAQAKPTLYPSPVNDTHQVVDINE